MITKVLIILILVFLPLFTIVGCEEECGLGAVFCEDDE